MGGVLASGQLRLSTAISWVDSLVVGSVSDWRLPERVIPEGYVPSASCPLACIQSAPLYGQFPSELSFLAGVTGLFSNVMNGNYLSWTSDMAWQELRNITTGRSVLSNETSLITGYVLAVRNGDVGTAVTAIAAPVPEPQTYALMLLGLGAVGAASRRQRSRTPRPA
ncbi:PEP-CTERM sorting domain-containing protein [Piscinibacter sp. HJYY11]|nr:PEP-CTERM sorting domain-containing protein [Piscinibacter sp. HJYY11]